MLDFSAYIAKRHLQVPPYYVNIWERRSISRLHPKTDSTTVSMLLIIWNQVKIGRISSMTIMTVMMINVTSKCCFLYGEYRWITHCYYIKQILGGLGRGGTGAYHVFIRWKGVFLTQPSDWTFKGGSWLWYRHHQENKR